MLARATDPEDHEVVVLAAFVVESASDEELTWVKSTDGRMDLFLPAGSLRGEPSVSILLLPRGDQGEDSLVLAGGPYEVSVYYDPALVAGADEALLRIHHWDESAGRWVSDGGALDLTLHFASAQVSRLGTFAVLARRDDPAGRLYLPLVMRGE